MSVTSKENTDLLRMERWMQVALEQARQAASEGEVPIGAVAVRDQEILCRDHNRSIQLSDPTAHAEVLVLREAGRKLGNYRLSNVDLYVTVEPCAMCAGALIWARIHRLVFGVRDEKSGAVFSRSALLEPGRFNHRIEVFEGVLSHPAKKMLRKFFSVRR